MSLINCMASIYMYVSARRGTFVGCICRVHFWGILLGYTCRVYLWGILNDIM